MPSIGCLASAQVPEDAIHWGASSGNVRIGWKIPGATFHSGEPVPIVACVGRDPDVGPPIRLEYVDVVDGLFKVEIVAEGAKTPARLTKDGEAMFNHDGFFEVRGRMLPQGDTQCHEILLNKWWDISKPGGYSVSISHVQRDATKITSFFTVRAPDFRITILPK